MKSPSPDKACLIHVSRSKCLTPDKFMPMLSDRLTVEDLVLRGDGFSVIFRVLPHLVVHSSPKP